MRLFLIGFMGSGKSRAARRLAEEWGWPRLDLDEMIEAEAGCTIAELFATQGELAFRRMEAQSLRQTAAWPRVVVASGGGAPCHSGNIDWMNRAGLTIFLDPPVDVLVRRLMAGRSERPLIRSLGDEEQLRRYVTGKLAERRPFYEQAAVHIQPSETDREAADLVRRHFSDITGH